MDVFSNHVSPDVWMDQILSSKKARGGGILKHPVADVDRIVGRDAFSAEVQRRGWQMIRNDRHYVIFCNARAPLRVRADQGSPLPNS